MLSEKNICLNLLISCP